MTLEWLEADRARRVRDGRRRRDSHAPLSRVALCRARAARRSPRARGRTSKSSSRPIAGDFRCRAIAIAATSCIRRCTRRSRTCRGRAGSGRSVASRSRGASSSPGEQSVALVWTDSPAARRVARPPAARVARLSRAAARAFELAVRRRRARRSRDVATARRADRRAIEWRVHARARLVSQLHLCRRARPRPRFRGGSRDAGCLHVRSRGAWRGSRSGRASPSSIRGSASGRGGPHFQAELAPRGIAVRRARTHRDRRLSVVRRLGPRHVHLAARPVSGHRPARRRPRDPARVGDARSTAACCPIASAIATASRSTTRSTPRSGS